MMHLQRTRTMGETAVLRYPMGRTTVPETAGVEGKTPRDTDYKPRAGWEPLKCSAIFFFDATIS
jgi:hypothetical protein